LARSFKAIVARKTYLFRALVRHRDIIDGNYDIHWLERYLAGTGAD
jgi:hypothetical protein